MKKIVALLLCLASLFVISSCAKKESENNENDERKQTQVDSAYEAIITKYKDLLNAKMNSEELQQPSDPENEIEIAVYDTVNMCTEPEQMGYATKDINGDGIDELVLMRKDNGVYALFTIDNDAPVLLLCRENKATYIAIIGGTVYYEFKKQENLEHAIIKKIVDGKLEGIEFGYEKDGETYNYFRIENGTRTETSAIENRGLMEEMNSVMINPMWRTKSFGFRFVSAINSDSNSNDAPIADFSDYDKIISAYKKIVGNFATHKEIDWINGEYDSFYTFLDNESYEIFHRIYNQGYNLRPSEKPFGQEYDSDGNNSYGYAIKDINGDGIEELVLLNDQYEIIDLYTMNDGKAVLLKGAQGTHVGADGLFRVCRIVSFATGKARSDECYYTYEIKDGKLECISAFGCPYSRFIGRSNWFKTENGSRVSISDEEGERLYKEFDVRTLGLNQCSTNEYTKRFSGLEFIPLFEKSKFCEDHIGKFTQSAFINGDELTLSSTSDKTISFEYLAIKPTKPEEERGPDYKDTRTTVKGTAVKNGDVYTFEQDGIKGYIEFAINSMWFVITESENENVDCGMLLFDSLEQF